MTPLWPSADRYAVIGNPIAHSKSPWLHARFAALTGELVAYGRVLSPIDGFEQTVRSMVAGGMRGANVTVPFKFEAFAMCHTLTARARQAGAVNTLSFAADGSIAGDNTDGAGLVNDLIALSGSLQGKRLLVLGAGGAVSGVLRPLLDAGVSALAVLNRTAGRAEALLPSLQQDYPHVDFVAGGFDTPSRPVDMLINGTASSLQDSTPDIGQAWYAGAALAYDMMYGAQPTPFMQQAQACGVAAADGLGMLAAQAAEAFFVWRGVRPPTARVLGELRALLQGGQP